MRKNSNLPLFMVTAGMFSLVMGGFFTVMHVGEMARQNNVMRYGFTFRGGQPADKAGQAPVAAQPAGFAADLRLGGKVIAGKASGLANDLFSWMGKNQRSGAGGASAQRPPDSSDSPAQSDPFADFYNSNYGASSGGSASYGGGFSGGFGDSGGSVAAMRPPDSAGLNGKRAWHGTGLERAAAKAAALQRQAQTGQPLFGGPVDRYAANVPPMQASLPGGAPASAGVRAPSAGLQASYPAAAERAPAGGLDAMRGGVAAGGLDGAGEGTASGSRGSFNMKMAMGAGSVGGGSGGGSAAPDASPAAAAAGGAAAGDSGGDSSGSGGGSFSSMASGPSLAKSPDKAGAKTSSSTAGSGGGADQGTFFWGASAAQPFLRTVALERRSGANSKYLAEADYSSSPDRAMLRAGAVLPDKKAQPANTRLLMMSQAPEPQDPEKFAALSQARKTELKKEIFSFLKRFENKYGGMSDITYTSCSDAVELCEKNGLTEGYLTEVTVKGAKIQLALKYSGKQWRPYTISVKIPSWLRDQASAPAGAAM